ncbi:MAG: hypothetical protein ACRDP7_24130, partial [Trebonia sp.]
IRRAGTAAAHAAHHPGWDGDTGFRVLRVDSSNMADVHRIPALAAQDDLALLTDTVKRERTAEDVLFEVLIGCGADLSAPIAVEKIDGREVFLVGDGTLIACLARDPPPAVVREIARRAPSRAVFLDSGFTTDADRVNAQRTFAHLAPATEVRVI